MRLINAAESNKGEDPRLSDLSQEEGEMSHDFFRRDTVERGIRRVTEAGIRCIGEKEILQCLVYRTNKQVAWR